jgi:membrane protein required for colicin V production
MVFAIVLVIGAIISTIVGRFFKLIGLEWADRVLGAGFGLVRGLLVCVVIVMIMLAFSPGSMHAAVANSTTAPYIVGASKVLSAVTPNEIKEGVLDGYDRAHKIWKDTLKKKLKKQEETSEKL